YMHGVQVWNMAERSRAWVGRAHPTIVRCVAWSPDSTRLASCGDDGAICLWRTTDGAMLQVLREHSASVAVVAWSPDGSLLASCGEDGTVKLWEMESAELMRTLRRDRPYERLNITGTRGLSPAQKASLLALGAFEEEAALHSDGAEPEDENQ